MLANSESCKDLEPEPEPESIDEFGRSNLDYSVPDADSDATSLLEELPSDAEFFEQPVKKGKGKQKAKGDTCIDYNKEEGKCQGQNRQY
jgi:hypothetical protein